MARPLRIEYEGAIYHITSRGNERKPIFIDDEDRQTFLDILAKVNKLFNWICHGYCLMGNHYHLIIETPDANLSKGMRQLNGVYTQTFNRRHNRTGHIFEGRFKAILAQKEAYLLELCRYVVLNPVRAKIVKTPQEYRWSSYGATSGAENNHPCLTLNWALQQFAKKASLARKEYRKFVIGGLETESIWIKLKGQILLGEDDFIEKFKDQLKVNEDVKEIPRSQRFVNRPKLGNLFNNEILHNKKMRAIKIKEAVEKYRYSQKEIADYLGMHYSSISRLMNENELMSRIKT